MRKNRELEVNVWCFGGSCTAPGQTHSSATHECNSLFILIFSRQHLTSFHFPACSGRDVWSRRSAHTWTVTWRVDSLDACKKIKIKKKRPMRSLTAFSGVQIKECDIHGVPHHTLLVRDDPAAAGIL